MENIIGTKTSIKILSYLLKNPVKEFKEIELVSKSKVGKGAGAVTINRLHSLNIIKIKKVGKTKIISLNSIYPVTFSLRELFDRHRFLTLPENRISAISLFRERIYNQSKAIILFGSLAAGTFDENSDIDLLIITENEDYVKIAGKEVHDLTGENINIHFLKPEDANKEFKENDLIRTALINGVLVYGGDYVREIMKQPGDQKELKFLKERINAAWRNYTNGDYDSSKEIIRAVSENMAFFACKLEGTEALSRKDAMAKLKKSNEYKVLGSIGELEIENALEILEEHYNKLFNKLILKGEGIERRIKK